MSLRVHKESTKDRMFLYNASPRDRTDSERSLRKNSSGIKYFVLSALSSGLLLYGCSLLYGFTGSTNFDLIANELNKENIGAVFAIVFILVGLAFKVSAVPFHMWTLGLPDLAKEGVFSSILFQRSPGGIHVRREVISRSVRHVGGASTGCHGAR